MPFFPRRRGQDPTPPPPAPQGSAPGEPDPLGGYADVVTVIVRHTPAVMTADPDYDVATVTRFSVGGQVPAEAVRSELMRWLVDQADFPAQNEVAIRRRQWNMGASGAEAEILLSLIGGVAGGIAGSLTQRAAEHIGGRLSAEAADLELLPQELSHVDQLRGAVSRAFDIRPSDLSLVEQRSSPRHHAAVFEDTAGRFYGVRVEGEGITIRRLKPGDW